MPRRVLVSPARGEDEPEVTAASHIAHAQRIVHSVQQTLSRAVAQAEVGTEDDSSSHSRAVPRKLLWSSLNVYRRACLSALAALQSLETADTAAPRQQESTSSQNAPSAASHDTDEKRRTDGAHPAAASIDEVHRLQQLLRQQEAEAHATESVLRAQIDELNRAVRTLQVHQNLDFEALEKYVRGEARSDATALPRHSPPSAVSPRSSTPTMRGTSVPSTWWETELFSMEAHTRTHITEQEGAERELVAHRQLLARAVVRSRRAPRTAMEAGSTVVVTPERPSTSRLDLRERVPSPGTRDVSVLEADVQRLAEHAATLQQHVAVQQSQMQAAVVATRGSMETVHLRALEKLAARHDGERRVLEERLTAFAAELAALREQHARAVTERRQQAKLAREHEDTAAERIEDLVRQVTAAKKRVALVELEKERLQARVRVLQRQLEDTVPRRPTSVEQHTARDRVTPLDSDPGEARERPLFTASASDTVSVSPAGVSSSHEADGLDNPGRLFERYPEDGESDANEEDADAEVVGEGDAQGRRHVQPHVWQTVSKPAITVTALHAPMRAARDNEAAATTASPDVRPARATVEADDGLVTTPHTTSAARRRHEPRDGGETRAADVARGSSRPVHPGGRDRTAQDDVHAHARMIEGVGAEGPVSAASLSMSPAPVVVATGHSVDARLDAMIAELKAKMASLEESAHQAEIKHEVRRQQRQREGRHLQTTRHYYEHALGLASSRSPSRETTHEAGVEPTPSAAATAAKAQLDSINEQLELIRTASASEEAAFAVKMHEAQRQYEALATLLKQVQMKQAAV